MSKITKALEKAARERLEHRQMIHPTVTPKPVHVPLAVAAAAPAVQAHEAVVAPEAQIDAHIVSATDPQSPISEQYRILRTNLQSQKALGGGAKVLVITSAMHGEGKSVTSINLALALAQQEGLRVLLVDGDLRRGTVH